MHRLSAEVVAKLAPTALEKNIEIALNSENEKLIIDGLPTAISVLLRNIVDNAIRYTQEGGRVDVNLDNFRGRARLTVIDNGPGIPLELRDRAFERFFRIIGTKSQGSGLCLAIVQQIAKIHHAKVTLSEPKTGTGLKVEILFSRV